MRVLRIKKNFSKVRTIETCSTLKKTCLYKNSCSNFISFVFLCWQAEDRLPTSLYIRQWAPVLLLADLRIGGKTFCRIVKNTTNLDNCALFVWFLQPLGGDQHQALPLAPLQVCWLENCEVCDRFMLPSLLSGLKNATKNFIQTTSYRVIVIFNIFQHHCMHWPRPSHGGHGGRRRWQGAEGGQWK